MITQEKNGNQNRRLCSVKNVPTKYPDADISTSSIRWLIFNRDENGFSKCIVRIGRKILIDLELFEEYMDEQAYNGGRS
jgi:hypothetical protein